MRCRSHVCVRLELNISLKEQLSTFPLFWRQMRTEKRPVESITLPRMKPMPNKVGNTQLHHVVDNRGYKKAKALRFCYYYKDKPYTPVIASNKLSASSSMYFDLGLPAERAPLYKDGLPLFETMYVTRGK